MNTKVYVDNLAATTTESDLMKLFFPYGNVAEVNVPVDRANGRLRGFGFVTMATPETECVRLGTVKLPRSIPSLASAGEILGR